MPNKDSQFDNLKCPFCGIRLMRTWIFEETSSGLTIFSAWICDCKPTESVIRDCKESAEEYRKRVLKLEMDRRIKSRLKRIINMMYTLGVYSLIVVIILIMLWKCRADMIGY